MSLVNCNRFEGGAPWYDSVTVKLPKENPLAVDEYLDDTEVHTRISFVLHQFRLFDLYKLDWEANF